MYGAYFGAGLGVLLLAVLGITLPGRLGDLNAVRTVLALLVNSIAVVVFAVAAPVVWSAAAAMAAASLAGGYVGARTATPDAGAGVPGGGPGAGPGRRNRAVPAVTGAVALRSKVSPMHRRTAVTLAGLVLAAAGLAACGGDDGGGGGASGLGSGEGGGSDVPDDLVVVEGTEVTVTALDNSFRAAGIEVRPGTTVTWENKGRNDHDVLPVEGGGWGVEVEGFAAGRHLLAHVRRARRPPLLLLDPRHHRRGDGGHGGRRRLTSRHGHQDTDITTRLGEPPCPLPDGRSAPCWPPLALTAACGGDDDDASSDEGSGSAAEDTGGATLRVPEDHETIQAAVDAAAPATWSSSPPAPTPRPSRSRPTS